MWSVKICPVFYHQGSFTMILCPQHLQIGAAESKPLTPTQVCFDSGFQTYFLFFKACTPSSIQLHQPYIRTSTI